MTGPTTEFTRVRATPEEDAAYRKTHAGRGPAVYRVVCNYCGRRIWKSGIGVGSHRRHCTGRNH